MTPDAIDVRFRDAVNDVLAGTGLGAEQHASMAEELRDHLWSAYSAALVQGCASDEAATRALMRLGDLTSLRHRIRLERLRREVRASAHLPAPLLLVIAVDVTGLAAWISHEISWKDPLTSAAIIVSAIAGTAFISWCILVLGRAGVRAAQRTVRANAPLVEGIGGVALTAVAILLWTLLRASTLAVVLASVTEQWPWWGHVRDVVGLSCLTIAVGCTLILVRGPASRAPGS